jgi:hypothetical protein
MRPALDSARRLEPSIETAFARPIPRRELENDPAECVFPTQPPDPLCGKYVHLPPGGDRRRSPRESLARRARAPHWPGRAHRSCALRPSPDFNTSAMRGDDEKTVDGMRLRRPAYLARGDREPARGYREFQGIASGLRRRERFFVCICEYVDHIFGIEPLGRYHHFIGARMLSREVLVSRRPSAGRAVPGRPGDAIFRDRFARGLLPPDRARTCAPSRALPILPITQAQSNK